MLTGNQLVAQACQDANVPGFTAQAQLKLTVILDELAQTYDFSAARKTLNFFMPTAVNATGQATTPFPADYLRARPRECFYYISGVPYDLIPIDLAQMDALVTTAGFASPSAYFATDTSTTPATAYFWPPPSGAFPAVLRYQSLPATLTDFSQVPWFPQQMYLLTRLTGELFKTSDDERAESFLSDDEEAHPGGAAVVLRKFLKMKEDNENRSQNVQLDRRSFGGSYSRLRNTKLIGW